MRDIPKGTALSAQETMNCLISFSELLCPIRKTFIPSHTHLCARDNTRDNMFSCLTISTLLAVKQIFKPRPGVLFKISASTGTFVLCASHPHSYSVRFFMGSRLDSLWEAGSRTTFLFPSSNLIYTTPIVIIAFLKDRK